MGHDVHLTRPDQSKAFASVSRVLKPGAPFLFTAAELERSEDGIAGTMNGVTFHYYAVVRGRQLPHAARGGARPRACGRDDDPGVSTYFFARKSAK
jgi:hypothetical protein